MHFGADSGFFIGGLRYGVFSCGPRGVGAELLCLARPSATEGRVRGRGLFYAFLLRFDDFVTVVWSSRGWGFLLLILGVKGAFAGVAPSVAGEPGMSAMHAV